MFNRLFRRGREPAPAPSRAPADMAIYAIGDVHGRADLLKRLLEAIVEDALGLDEADRRIVLLGDYVDRGPDSRGVIDLLARLKTQTALRVHALLGNHDRMLLDFLADARLGPLWCQWGGRDTLASYGVWPATGGAQEADWEALREAFEARVPASHLAFLKGLEVSLALGDYFFVHAGVRPGVALAAQSTDDLLWIRAPFLDHRGAFEKVVVHGHSAAAKLQASASRIGVDTGAYGTNRLSAVRLRADQRTFLQTCKEDGAIKVIQVEPPAERH